jgi:transcriptional regulator with XRE-family HTH domain
VLTMTQTKTPGEPVQIVQRHLSDIRAWRAQGKTARGIAKELGLAETSYRRALADVENEQPPEVSASPSVLQELAELLPLLKAMVSEWQKQQVLPEIPEEYKKYSTMYSVRLSPRMIENLKKYAERNRLAQSDVVTLALQQLLGHD